LFAYHLIHPFGFDILIIQPKKIDGKGIYETPAGIASQARPHSPCNQGEEARGSPAESEWIPLIINKNPIVQLNGQKKIGRPKDSDILFFMNMDFFSGLQKWDVLFAFT
jgi:hypothetical protein